MNSLSRAGETNRANVAHFMCELATDDRAWAAWQGKLPVIVNTPARVSPAGVRPASPPRSAPRCP